MEKRRHRRTPLQRTVYLNSHVGGERKLQSLDFSLSGMAMFSEQPMPVGEKVWLRFKLNTQGHSRELNMQAEIRYVDLTTDSYRVGVNFIDPH